MHNGGSNTRLNLNFLLDVPDENTRQFVDEKTKQDAMAWTAGPPGGASPSSTSSPSTEGERRESEQKLLMRLGGQRAFGPHAEVLAYDDCRDVEFSVATQPVYLLQLGLMHPGLVLELENRQSSGREEL